MDSLPSWARVGQKVVCVDDYPHPLEDMEGVLRSPQTWNMKLPIKGEVYTISGVVKDGLLLKELSSGYIHPLTGIEMGFKISRFRPLISKSIEDDIAIFAPLLNTKKEEELV
jgi:hypothetical protein